MNATPKELEEFIALACESVALSLEDSPKSRMAQIYNHVGYYQGFCHAKEWIVNIDFVMRMIDLSNK